MKAHVYVTLKDEVLDPQGDAVRRALQALGFEQVSGARVGKLVEIDLEADDRVAAERQLRQMCEQLLANPVIEDFRFDLE